MKTLVQFRTNAPALEFQHVTDVGLLPGFVVLKNVVGNMVALFASDVVASVTQPDNDSSISLATPAGVVAH